MSSKIIVAKNCYNKKRIVNIFNYDPSINYKKYINPNKDIKELLYTDINNKSFQFTLNDYNCIASREFDEITILDNYQIGKSCYYIGEINDIKAVFYIYSDISLDIRISNYYYDIIVSNNIKIDSKIVLATTSKLYHRLVQIYPYFPHKELSLDWYKIFTYGVVDGKSDYYIAQRFKDKYKTVFHIDNPYKPLIPWCPFVYIKGAIKNNANYIHFRDKNFIRHKIKAKYYPIKLQHKLSIILSRLIYGK